MHNVNSVRKNIRAAALTIVLLSAACPAQTNTPSYVVVGGGLAGVLDDQKSIVGVVEFQPRLHVGPFGTWIGVSASDQENYLGAGLLLDWYVTERLFITPSLGAGIYGEHNGIDLGSRLEFRSGIECGYDLKEAGRISAGFWHLSNASLRDRNPGTELVALRYAFPLSKR
jgi:hypothetical protein